MDTETLKNDTAAVIAGRPAKRIMIAALGNLFLQDDGFGNAVIQQVQQADDFKGIEINNAGTGGLKLAYDLMKGYDALVLVDAAGRGEEPGTLYVIEPQENEGSAVLDEETFIDPHGTDAATVLRFIRALNAWPGKVIILGCEPAAIEDFGVGLSAPVAAAVDTAIAALKEIIDELNNDL